MNKRQRLKMLEQRIEDLKLQITDVEQRFIVFKTRGIMDRELTKLDKARQNLRSQLLALLNEYEMISSSQDKGKKAK